MSVVCEKVSWPERACFGLLSGFAGGRVSARFLNLRIGGILSLFLSSIAYRM